MDPKHSPPHLASSRLTLGPVTAGRRGRGGAGGGSAGSGGASRCTDCEVAVAEEEGGRDFRVLRVQIMRPWAARTALAAHRPGSVHTAVHICYGKRVPCE